MQPDPFNKNLIYKYRDEWVRRSNELKNLLNRSLWKQDYYNPNSKFSDYAIDKIIKLYPK